MFEIVQKTIDGRTVFLIRRKASNRRWYYLRYAYESEPLAVLANLKREDSPRAKGYINEDMDLACNYIAATYPVFHIVRPTTAKGYYHLSGHEK